MLPRETISSSFELMGVSNHTFSSSTAPITILGASMQQSGTSSDTTLMCNSIPLLKNYALNLSYSPLNYVCTGRFWINKTGPGDSAFAMVNYLIADRTLTPDADFSSNLTNGGIYTIDLLIIIAGLLFFDLIRRVFTQRRV